MAAGHLLACKTFGVDRSSFPPLEFDNIMAVWKTTVSSPTPTEDSGAVYALATMCASRDSVEDPLVAWSFEELDFFYATHIYALRKLVAASSPQVVLLAAPLLIGTVFYCSVLPNLLCVICDCCGKLLQTLIAVDSSRFVFRNDGMFHASLPEPLPVVDERLRTLGTVSIQMCGKKRMCNRTECACNRKAVLCHSETIRTNISSKTVEWMNKKCIW